MKKINPIITASLAGLLVAGCQAMRPETDIAAAGGGALIGNELSHGDPAMTATGAAGGVLLSEGGFYLSRKESKKAATEGYEKGRSDAFKQQYWIQVNQQRTPVKQDSVRLYSIPIPEQTVDGVVLNPTTKYFRIEE
ncbi:MAG TPA: hypothetical protein VGN61_01855 [Verrucomicrobiae bacterium]